jgi:hypothetical protein
MHRVRISQKDFGYEDQSVTIEEEKSCSLTIQLRKFNGFSVREPGNLGSGRRGTGGVSIEADINDSSILIDGKEVVGVSTPVTIDDLQEGVHRVEIVNGNRRTQVEATVASGQTVVARLFLDPQNALTAKKRLAEQEAEARRQAAQFEKTRQERNRLEADRAQKRQWLDQVWNEARQNLQLLKQSRDDKIARRDKMVAELQERINKLLPYQTTTAKSEIRSGWNVSSIRLSVPAFDPEFKTETSYGITFSRYNDQVTLDTQSDYLSLIEIKTNPKAVADSAFGIPLRYDRISFTFSVNRVHWAIAGLTTEKQAVLRAADLEIDTLTKRMAAYQRVVESQTVEDASAALLNAPPSGNDPI